MSDPTSAAPGDTPPPPPPPPHAPEPSRDTPADDTIPGAAAPTGAEAIDDATKPSATRDHERPPADPPPPPAPPAAPGPVPAPNPAPPHGYPTTTPRTPVPPPPTGIPQPPPPSASTGAPRTPGRAPWLVPLLAAGAGLVLGLGGALGLHLIENASMASSLTEQRSTLTTTVAAADEGIAAAAEDFGASTPDLIVLDYLQGLEAGEVDTEFETGLAPDGVGVELLTTETYAKTSYRVNAPAITTSSIDEKTGSATVTATYRIGPEREEVTDEFDLQLLDGTWHLNDTAAVVVPMTVDREGTVTVNGVDVTSNFSDSKGTLSAKVALLPGQYGAGFSEGSGFWGAKDATVTVTDVAAPEGIDVITTVSPAVEAEVQAAAQAQVNAWFDECANSRFTAPSCSGTVLEEGGYISDKQVLRVYVQTYPTVAVSWNEDTNTFGYTGFGIVATDGIGPTGNVTRPLPLGYSGTLTWHGPGNIEIPIGIV